MYISLNHQKVITLDFRSIKGLKLKPFNVRRNALQVFDEMCKWDRASVEIEIVESTFQRWAEDVPSSVSVHGHHWILDPQHPCQIEICWCSFLIAFKRRTLMPFSLNLSIRMSPCVVCF
ncbi:hypothetical protein HanPI659440_Chr13g0506541 [Helianthus annuus]|nr:hypothetical protein HanPI659440_Chr13g0506541 [Helianthus annuus]